MDQPQTLAAVVQISRGSTRPSRSFGAPQRPSRKSEPDPARVAVEGALDFLSRSARRFVQVEPPSMGPAIQRAIGIPRGEHSIEPPGEAFRAGSGRLHFGVDR
jgi:hypothetical protein